MLHHTCKKARKSSLSEDAPAVTKSSRRRQSEDQDHDGGKILSPDLTLSPTDLDYTKEAYTWKCMNPNFLSFYSNSLHKATGINFHHRKVLLCWLLDLANHFEYSRHTWCLTANLLDRYLSAIPVTSEILQLVGAVAFMLAAKHEEIKPPKPKELKFLSGDQYKTAFFLRLEVQMLIVLDFRLYTPTVASYLEDIEHVNDKSVPEEERDVFKHLLDKILVNTVMDARTAYLRPSSVARAIFILLFDWTPSRMAEMEYRDKDLVLVKQDMDHIFRCLDLFLSKTYEKVN